MSKLIDESPLVLLPSLACKLGLNEAVFLQQLHYWLTPSNQWKPHYREYQGKVRPWIFNTYEKKVIKYTDSDGNEQEREMGWESQFPFWSTRTIMRVVTGLRSKGLIITTAQFNGNSHNRTEWYTIDYDQLAVTLDSDNLSPSNTTDCHLPTGQDVTFMTETTTETTTESEPPAPKLDPLSHLLTFEKVSESSAPNPDDQYWQYRDEYLKTFQAAFGRYPSGVEKEEIVSLATQPLASPQTWAKAIKQSILNWSGNSRLPPLSRVIEVYEAGGDYELWRKKKYPDTRTQEKPDTPAPPVDQELYRQIHQQAQQEVYHG